MDLYLLAALSMLVHSNAARTYKAVLFNRCLGSSITALSKTTYVNELHCATQCSFNPDCYVYQINLNDRTCSLHGAMFVSLVMNWTISQPGVCVIRMDASYTPPISVMFTTSGTFYVPMGITKLNVLVVGGGAGGAAGNCAAGGSGRVTFINLSVNFGQVYSMTVGSGGAGGPHSSTCSSASNGGPSSFDSLLTASGGGAPSGANGGNGGSGAGAGTLGLTNVYSGTGGSAGNNGYGVSSFTGGSGQGSFAAIFSQFKNTSFSFGSAASGVLGSEPYRLGGGGAGGVLVNGDGPSGGAGACCLPTVCAPESARGYGAGGSGGCYYSTTYTKGGDGADGLVYIEFSDLI